MDKVAATGNTDKRFRNITGNLLLVLDVFVLFLLVFEHRLQIPAWLQVAGRMHPLVLHFPLVLLVVAMGLEFFRFPSRHVTGWFYEQFATYLLVAGAALAGVTVIMGIFLSREEGYDGEVLDWHKWAGVGVLFFASLVFFLRKYKWYNRLLARVSAIIVLLLLLITGHYGAVLTHGEDFLLAPVSKAVEKTAVPLEEARIFADVISPIFEAKCVSCHNPSKSKGELLLTDSASIMKGGKSGKLFVPGDPDQSLLLRRIHLPEGDKKRMPPAGKPQLTGTEIELITRWVAGTGRFSTKITELPATDSFRVLASAGFSSTVTKNYDFPAADAGIISGLNNEYRVVSPLAAGSPALDVLLFNRAAWSPERLSELSPIKKQVVSLSLNALPVKDADLSGLVGFDNLELLNLNGTDISGEGLKVLSGLPALHTLSVSGTGLTAADLPVFTTMKKLKSLAIWNTRIPQDDLLDFRAGNPSVTVNAGSPDNGVKLKLNLPQVVNKVNVFSGKALLELSHPVKGVELRYTVDGTRPDSSTSFVYAAQEVIIDSNTTFHIRAFKEGWTGSEEIVYSFYEGRLRPDSMALLARPNEVHKANGVYTLFDQVLGNPANFFSGSWIGFSKVDVGVLMKFDRPVELTSVAFNTFQASYREFFGPVALQVWTASQPGDFRLVKSVKFTEEKNRAVVFRKIELPGTTARYVKLVFTPLDKLPGKVSKEKVGLVPVMLIDEILLN
ncbi:MAG: cytochrome C [Chitinophagaceae bacterium]|nr:MAG: cytochrome C [Chitinophagaceae bacterium]